MVAIHLEGSGGFSLSLSSELRRRYGRDLLVALAYLPLSVIATWPLTARLGTALAGDRGDAWQNLWNLAWFQRALSSAQNPFFTSDLWHPTGSTLVFQTFDLPDALLAAPLFGLFHPWTVYNLVVLATFVLSGASMYLLGRATGASRGASFASGCAYTFSTYHFGHALAHLHLLAMQWVPLYVLCLLRITKGGRTDPRWAVGAGVTLLLASLASWYYLVGCFLITLPILAAAARSDPKGFLRRKTRPLLGLCGVYLVLVLPLGGAMLSERANGPVEGAHSTEEFSADLESFVVLNHAQALADGESAFSKRHSVWSGNQAENANYLGLVLVGVCVAGLFFDRRRTAPYMAAALLGVVLALGPRLRIGGEVVSGEILPYAWVESCLPLLSFMGIPVRFAFAATFGLAAALAPSLDALAKRGVRVHWVCALALLAVLEHAPASFVTSTYPTPAPLVAWADNTDRFAVLDATIDTQQLWHQMLHRHPIFGGYLTRTPGALQESLAQDPVAGPMLALETPRHEDDAEFPALHFPANEAILPGADRVGFAIDLRGELIVPKTGPSRFRLESSAGGELWVGNQQVFGGGRGATISENVREATLQLDEGKHALRLVYQRSQATQALRVSWLSPGESRWRVLGAMDVPDGFRGRCAYARRAISVSRREALAHLRTLNVRYLIQPNTHDVYLVETQLGLAPIHAADGIRIYEVPRR